MDKHTVFPDKPITKRAAESRMGKGKGAVAYWAARVKSGTVLFEMCGVEDRKSIPAFKTGGAKLPIKTIIFN